MRNTKLSYFFLLALFAIPLFYASGCGGPASSAAITGLVVDDQFLPLYGAAVAAGINIVTSAADGSYNLGFMSNGEYVITISKPGYTTSYRKVLVSGASVQVPLAVLTPLDSKVTTILPAPGGLASNTDSSIKLDVPSGALSVSTDFSLTRVALVGAPYPPPAGSMFVAVIVFATPLNADFGTGKATISIPNLTGLISGTSVPFYHFDPDIPEWQLLVDAGGVAINTTQTKLITAEISEMGWLAAILPYTPNAGNISGVITDLHTASPIPYASVWYSSFFTVADNFGSYRLDSVPTGEATVEAIAAGYKLGSTTVNVVTDSTITANIALDPVIYGTITGHIYDSTTYGGIYSARVLALPSNLETMTDAYGAYTISNIPIGNVSIRALANGYLGSTESVGSLGFEETKIKDMYLHQTTSPTAFADDFETDKGWETTTDRPSCQWQRLTDPQTKNDSLHPTYVTLPVTVNLPAAHSGNHCYWFGVTVEGTSPEGSYVGIQDPTEPAHQGGSTYFGVSLVRGELISPTIDLSAAAYAKLSFWTWWEMESEHITSFDLMHVYVSTDNGSTWTAIGLLNPTQDPDQSQKLPELPYSSGGFNRDGVWVKHLFDLTPYVGNNIKVKFKFDSVDWQFNGFRGWLIDDFEVNPEAMSASSISSSAVERRPDGGIIKGSSR